MTMHLAHPSLSTTGKKAGKKKHRSARAAQESRRLQSDWEELKTRWGCQDTAKKKTEETKPYVPKVHPNLKPRQHTQAAQPRADSWDPCVKAPDRVYTGDKIIGIGTMHKSNAVPIFSDQDAKDISSMRR